MRIAVIPIIHEPPASLSCDTCEACCCRLEVLLITDTGVPNQYIKKSPHEISTMLRLADGWCAALDRNTMRCSIYDVRPLICREFELGEADCRTERAKFGC